MGESLRIAPFVVERQAEVGMGSDAEEQLVFELRGGKDVLRELPRDAQVSPGGQDLREVDLEGGPNGRRDARVAFSSVEEVAKDPFRLLQTTELVGYARELEDELRLSLAVPRVQVALALEGAGEKVAGDVWRRGALGDLGGDAVVLDRFPVHLAEIEVAGETEDPVQVPSAHRLPGLTRVLMEEAAAALADVAVHLLPEPILWKLEEFVGALQKEPLTDETGDNLREALLVLAAHTQEKAKGELWPEHRGDVERTLRLPVEGGRPRRRRAPNLAAGAGPTVKLLEEEGIPTGLGEAPRDLLGGDFPGRSFIRRKLATSPDVSGCRTICSAWVARSNPSSCDPPRSREGSEWTAGRQNPEGPVLDLVCEELYGGQRRLVRAMELVEDEDRGAPLSELEELIGDPCQDPFPRLLAPLFDLVKGFEEPLFDADPGRKGRLSKEGGEVGDGLVAVERGSFVGPEGPDRRACSRRRTG